LPYTTGNNLGAEPERLYNWAISGMIKDEIKSWRGSTMEDL